MNLDKLAVQPQEIDKHTGRIILPSSEQLEEVKIDLPKPGIQAGMRAQLSAEKASQSASVTQTPPPRSAPTPPPAQVAPISPNPIKISDFHPYWKIRYSDMDPTAAHALPARPSGWTLSSATLAGLCLILLTVPLSFACAILVKENIRMKDQFTSLDERLTDAEGQKSLISNRELNGNLRLEKELTLLRHEVSKFNLAVTQIEIVEEVEPEALAEENSEWAPEGEVIYIASEALAPEATEEEPEALEEPYEEGAEAEEAPIEEDLEATETPVEEELEPIEETE